MKARIVLPTIVLLAAAAIAGEQKPLDHSVYAIWKSIRGEVISPDGKWAAYALEPGEGDATLIVMNLETGRADTILRGTGCSFSDDSRYAAFTIKPQYSVLKKARIDKKKADDLPKDSLGIMVLGTSALTRIPRVKSFVLPEKWSGWIAYQLEKPLPPPADTLRKGKKDQLPVSDAPEDEQSKKDERGTTVTLRALESGKEWQFRFADEYTFSKTGGRFLVSTAGGDSAAFPGVFTFDTGTSRIDTLAVGTGKYKQIALDEAGAQAAFLADRDTSKAKQRFFALYWWSAGQDSAIRVVDTLTAGMKQRWTVNENGDVKFSHNGKRIMLGTAPVPVPDDTTFNDEETAQLDIWHWQDPTMQPEQLKNLDKEKKRTFVAVWHVDRRKLVQLGDPDLPEVEVGDRGDAEVAMATSDVPYRRERMWTGATVQDVYVLDVASGTKIKLLERIRGPILLSPAARYVAYYDFRKRHWFTSNVATLRTVQVTRDITVPLYDEREDHPDDPGPHGQAGWTEGDRRFLVYDRYDLWSTDPSGKEPSVCVTAGSGRKSTTRYRALRLDPEERALKENTLVRIFQEKDKGTGFAFVSLSAPAAPRMLVSGPYQFAAPQKARKDSTVIFTRGNFQEFPDLYASDFSFARPRRISTANPQQADYLWGTVELISWKPADGKPLEGLLFKPARFDPRKKYPMIVYYYERDSDLLHQHRPPAPSRSTVNPSFYSSRGYVVFIPDIRYRVGHPGKSAMDAIISGTKAVLARGFVDKDRMGLQGQSWGGYETAYLITQTSMFHAAMAGAPVANMTSAYGGIRWESGWSRAWQYEKAQSRIGASLWEATPLYIENSPLFFAPKVTTPLLIMHNDADGAVPWYQGIELFSALRRLNKPVWMLTYNNEEHNLTKWKNRKDLSVRMSQFFDHYLKGEPMPEWMAKGRSALDKQKTMSTGSAR